MDKLKHVTYCGLYCRLCANFARIPRQASALRDTMRRDGWEDYGPHVLPGFKEFWAALGRLSRLDRTCPGCRGGCGPPHCEIRPCARERGVEVCSACEDFPCARIEPLAARYPNLISDALRQREIGLEAWIKEQEDRCRRGFAYGDIRHP